jgi:hypothetical protein
MWRCWSASSSLTWSSALPPLVAVPESVAVVVVGVVGTAATVETGPLGVGVDVETGPELGGVVPGASGDPVLTGTAPPRNERARRRRDTGDPARRGDRAPARCRRAALRVRAPEATSGCDNATARPRDAEVTSGAAADRGVPGAMMCAVARGVAGTKSSGRLLAATPPTMATVDAAATTLVTDAALAVAPLPNVLLTRCGSARNVIHSADGLQPV